jgi:serpin B
MVFILPKEPGGLPALEKSLTASTLDGWLSRLFATEVDLRLPRFSVRGNFALKNSFMALGMRAAFDPVMADFSGMDGKHFPESLLIDEIFHQATTEVNEQGATATAATAVVMKLRAIQAEPEFHADHPFLFLIREKSTGNLLFLGRVSDPCGSEFRME